MKLFRIIYNPVRKWSSLFKRFLYFYQGESCIMCSLVFWVSRSFRLPTWVIPSQRSSAMMQSQHCIQQPPLSPCTLLGHSIHSAFLLVLCLPFSHVSWLLLSLAASKTWNIPQKSPSLFYFPAILIPWWSLDLCFSLNVQCMCPNQFLWPFSSSI